MKKKLIKITFEYEDGKVSWLEGDDADKWLSAANSMTMMSSVHGNSFPELKWKKIKKSSNAIKSNRANT